MVVCFCYVTLSARDTAEQRTQTRRKLTRSQHALDALMAEVGTVLDELARQEEVSKEPKKYLAQQLLGNEKFTKDQNPGEVRAVEKTTSRKRQ